MVRHVWDLDCDCHACGAGPPGPPAAVWAWSGLRVLVQSNVGSGHRVMSVASVRCVAACAGWALASCAACLGRACSGKGCSSA